MAVDSICIFCQITAGEADASFIYQDELVSAFMDLFPATNGHLIIIPNHHAELISDVDPETAARMFQVGAKLGAAIRSSGLRCDAVSYYLADGAEAGQVVKHAHLHVLPRYPGDKCGLRLHAGPVEIAQRKELDQHAESIRNHLDG